MAALAERYQRNSLVHEFTQTPVVGNTGIGSLEIKPTDFLPNPPRQTPERSSNTAAHAITTEVASRTSQQELPNALAAKTIDGVVSEIKNDSIVIEVTSVGEDHLKLSLPPSLFSDELRKYGTPVRVSLDSSLGYRRPVVQARDIATPARLPGQDAVDDWLRSN
jgi:hypothetical protein